MALRALNQDCGYTVRPGDSLATIAAAFGVNVFDLKAANNCARPVIGQSLFIPGHACVMGKTPGRGATSGLQGLRDVDTWSGLPDEAVYPGEGVVVTINVGFLLSSTVRAQLERDVMVSLLRYWSVWRLATSGSFITTLTVIVTANAPTSTRAVAHAVWNAVSESGTGVEPGLMSATLYSVINNNTGGFPTSPTGIPPIVPPAPPANTPGTPPIIAQPPPVNTASPATTVYPGDKVKVWAEGGGIFGTADRVTANLTSRGYSVINFDHATGLGNTPIYILVSPTSVTNLGSIAADANWALSAGGYSVTQSPPPYATIFSRAAPGAAPPVPGSTGVPLNAGGGQVTPSTAGSVLDDIANTLGTSTGLPLTGAIVAVVAGVVLLIVLKT